MATIITAENPRNWKRRCDATCHTAKRPLCTCICRGRYHGVGDSKIAQERLYKDCRAMQLTPAIRGRGSAA